MEYIGKIIGSAELSGIFEIPPSLRGRKVQVIVLPAEDNDNELNEPNYALKLGFLKNKIPPLPDSFFDPLPEEELQLWGL